jgi:hypothetical protein
MELSPMKKILVLAIAAATAAALTPAGAADAPGEVLDVTFSGVVATTVGGTGYAIGASVTGEFVYSTTTNSFDFFTVGGQSIPTGFDSSASITPSLTDAIYQAQISPVSTGGTISNTFNLDLSSLTTWPSTNDAVRLLTDANQLATNLDTVTNPLSAFPSTFSYYTANADGSNVVSLSADLTSLQVTAPEPASLTLLATSLLGFGAMRRRRS